jgi:hypothetical protein
MALTMGGGVFNPIFLLFLGLQYVLGWGKMAMSGARITSHAFAEQQRMKSREADTIPLHSLHLPERPSKSLQVLLMG